MPIEDALNLLARMNYEQKFSQKAYMSFEPAKKYQYKVLVADHEIQYLPRMLVDGSSISLSNSNLLIKYLSETRDKLQSSKADDGMLGRMLFTVYM